MQFASASLTFYNPNRRYLMCTETRSSAYNGPKDTLMFHTIGGKVEANETILNTAIRKFVEETQLPEEYGRMILKYHNDGGMIYTAPLGRSICCQTRSCFYIPNKT